MDINKKLRVKRWLRSTLTVVLVIAIVLTSIPLTSQAATNTSKVTLKNSKIVSTQTQLTKALADKRIVTITIKTSDTQKFTIPNKTYKKKTLVIHASKVSVTNSGTFKKIIVTDAKTITENAKGNNIVVNDMNVTMNVAKSAKVKTITFDRKNAKCNIATKGDIDKLVLAQKTELVITGNISDSIAVQIETAAKGSLITSSVRLDVKTAADADIILKKGAEGSTVTSIDKDVNLKVENTTTKSIDIITPDGKETLITGKTWVSKKEPTKKPENPENPTTPNTGGTSETTYYTVTYDTNGGALIDSITVASGEKITSLPIPQKDNSIFLGWYTDSGYQNEFSEDTAVYSKLTLYSKYLEIETQQENLDDSYALTEQKSDLSFTILSTDMEMTADGVKNALVLEVADGTETVNITVTGSKGTFLVAAQNGFSEGASYTLTLSDSKLSYKDKENTIRKCSFNITKAEVYNIELNDAIIYIPNSEVSDMTKNGTQVEALSVPVVDMTKSENSDEPVSGTFTYVGSEKLKTADVLCIYNGDKPIAPNGEGNDAEFMDDKIAYVKVKAVVGSTGSQAVTYSEADDEEVISIPDVLPIAVSEGNKLMNYTAARANASGSFTAATADLNFDAFKDMGLTEETTVDKGDFIAFYTGTLGDTSSADSVVYGEVTSVTEDNGSTTVSFTETTAKRMKEVQDYYSKNDVDGDALLSDVDIASLEREIEQQVIESGFAEDASTYLTALTLETDGFEQMAGDDYDLEDFSIKMADGEIANLNEIKSMSASSKSSNVSINNLKVKANIGKNLQKLSGSGVRCGLTVSFDVQIKAGDGNAIVIAVSATFVEEIKLGVDASGKAIWKKWWIFPYIADYQMNANIDIYNYTGINFQAKIYSKANTDTIDISKEIQKILSSTDSEQISSGVKEIFEIYSDMMENESDWIDIFSKEIFKNDTSLLLGIIQVRTKVDFVVSANINIALGCNFDYISGTRYAFWARIGSKDAGSNTIDLIDEQYTFQFYVMGSLGLRAGVRIEFAVGLFSVDLNSIGFTAEAGVYTKLYGYFFYQLESVNKIKNSKMSGALYLDFGIYLEIMFKAQVLNGKYQYNPMLYENEWPLLSAGTKYNVYNFGYDNKKESIKLKDTVKSYTLPDSIFSMTYLDLKEGDISTKTYKASDYNITFSNSNFSLSGNTVKVNVPVGTHELECDMTITWKGSPLAFSSLPITRTFHFSWDDLNDKGYTISFDSNGGSAVSSITKKYGITVTEPIAPQKPGYTFAGWYSNESLTNSYTFSTMPAKNIVLYAKWTTNTNTQYKVEHYQQNIVNDNYTLYSTQTLSGTTGSTVSASSMSYAGFTYNNIDGRTVSSGSITAEGSLVLRQYYDRNSYTLSFIPDNGGNNIVKTVKYGAVISAPTVVKKGHQFKNWDNTVTETMPAENVTYNAYWTPNNYTIEFDTNGGSTVDKIAQAYGTIVNAPTIPTKAGYIFGGWYSNEALGNAYTFSTMPAESIILYAKWNLDIDILYKVEHYQQNVSDNGYELQETENLIGKTGDTVAATAKTYDGFTFNNSVNGTVNSGVVVADGSLTLKLYYDRNTYTINFNSNAGSSVEPINQKYGTSVSVPTNPTRTSFNFEGWYTDNSFTTLYTFVTMPAESITLYAKWVTDGTEAKYPLWVGGVQVTTINMSNITGDGITGMVSYDPAINTLILNNATITGTQKEYYHNTSCIFDGSKGQPLIIKVIGENTIDLSNKVDAFRLYGIDLSNNALIIQGDSTSSLNIFAGTATDISGGFSINGGLTITGGVTVTGTGGYATGEGSFSVGVFDWNKININVSNNSVLKLYGGNANTSKGYLNNYGSGCLSIENGGQIILGGNTKAMDGIMMGATKAWIGQMIDGSDGTIYSGSTLDGWYPSTKYVHAIAE